MKIYKNGNKFEGIYKENKEYSGKGYIYYSNGDIYNGNIEEGMKNGEGEIIYNNKNRFKGKFKENKEYEGEGNIYYLNGDEYEGEIRNGLKEGEGIIIRKNGDKFKGIWKEDKEYTGIYYINKNGKNIEKRIEKRKKKENELIDVINNNSIKLRANERT